MKTCVLDASALFAFLQNTSAAKKINELLKEANRGHARLLMSVVNYAELYGKMLHDHGIDQALSVAAGVTALPIELVITTPTRAMRAAEVKVQYQLHLSDSFAAALAIENKATLVTSDSDFRRLGRSVPVLWLKNLKP